MKEINTTNELHEILLNLGKEFHKICTKNDIPYYMLGGTMLGAIRHKGFIPWDDDMDFGVPRKYYEKCIATLRDQLPTQYKLQTIDNSDSLLIDIIKISDERTIINEMYKENVQQEIGINIDIFPIDSMKTIGMKNHIIAFLVRLQNYIFLSHKSRPFVKKTIALFLKSIFFFLKKRSIINLINYHLLDYEGEYMTNIYGAWGIKETVKHEIMGHPTLYQFEDTQFYGVENYSSYLSSLYNDYMQLPPETKRHLHLKNVYWK